MACKSPRNRVWCNSVQGKAKGSVVLEPAKKTPKKRQNRANLLIMVSSRFQRLIQVEWPAKTQETEFGVIRSRGKRRTASSMSRPKKRQKCSREQNWGNVLILVFFRFQHPIPVEWPAKAQETKFGAIWSMGTHRTASSWSQPKNRQKLLQGAKLG